MSSKNQKIKKMVQSPNIPTAVWRGRDLLDNRPVDSLTIIFRTIGCYWSRISGCTMCGFINDSATIPPTEENVLNQLDHALKKMESQTSLLKIFTSGSFFDDREIPPILRKRIVERIADIGTIKKIVVETRPEFVDEQNLNSICEILDSNDIRLEIAIGLETSSDTIRMDCINKGFTFNDFIKASDIARVMGVSIKVYLLLKPPFLSEKTAVNDILASISDTVPYATTISLNLCNVQKGTMLEELFNRNDYRPPWLWSAVHILKKSKKMFSNVIFMSDPVAAGSKRGPHNCNKCNSDVAQSLRDFSIKQDIDILTSTDCECYSLWEKVIELEDNTYGSYLAK
jgi:radical SAM enzyme (TIGR01210 family)